METVDGLINESKEVRELKRAISVKMLEAEIEPEKIAKVLNVTEQYVSKWKGIHQQKGADGLKLGYQGSQGYLSAAQREAIVEWIKEQESITVEGLRDYLEAEYEVVYCSKQSYYELLKKAGLSYHRTTATNPKKDETQILEKREEIKKKWQSIKPK